MRPMIILMRHGETDWNKTSKLMSRTDHPLSSEGVDQVLRTAVLNSDVPIKRIYTSPLLRARQTATIMQSKLKITPEIIIDDRLREIDFGTFEGMTRAEINSSHLSLAYSNWQLGIEDNIGGAESWLNGAKRGTEAYDSIATVGETALIVSHGYLCRAIISYGILRCPIYTLRRLRFDNARLSTIELEDGLNRITSFNVFDITNIQDDKPTS